MKSVNVFLLALVTFSLFTLSACQKDPVEDIVPEPQTVYFGNFLLMQDIEHGKCVPGLSFCLTARPEDPHNAETLPLGMDEFLARPKLNSDGSLVFEGKLKEENLSPEAAKQFLERRRIVVRNGFTLDEDLVRQAFEDAGIDFGPGESPRIFEVPQGEYEVLVDEELDATGQRIKITITIKLGPVTIVIEIE